LLPSNADVVCVTSTVYTNRPTPETSSAYHITYDIWSAYLIKHVGIFRLHFYLDRRAMSIVYVRRCHILVILHY